MNLLESVCIVVLIAFALVGALAVAVVVWAAALPASPAQWTGALSIVFAAQSLAAWAQTLCTAAGFLLVASVLTRR